MNLRRLMIPPLVLSFLSLLLLPRSYATPTAQGSQQGFSVSIGNICGRATAAETIFITSVVLTLNTLPIASQPVSPPKALTTGESATFAFSTSQFPALANFTPNDVTIVWLRGQEQMTTTIFPITLGLPVERSCLRVLLFSGTGGGEVGSAFRQVKSLVSSTANRLGVSVNTDEAKLLQVGATPIIMAPTTTSGATIGVASIGDPLSLGGRTLTPGDYTVDLDLTKQEIGFRNVAGMEVARVPAMVQPVAGPSSEMMNARWFQGHSLCQAVAATDKPLAASESLATAAFVGCVGPTIGFSLIFIPVPPFVLFVTCIGFICHPFHPFPPYVSVSFCF